jgi:hypothetical protein
MAAHLIVEADGKRTVELFQWELIPSWAKDPAIGNKMINPRRPPLFPASPLPATASRLERRSIRFRMR